MTNILNKLSEILNITRFFVAGTDSKIKDTLLLKYEEKIYELRVTEIEPKHYKHHQMRETIKMLNEE
jgi:hypothetical protein